MIASIGKIIDGGHRRIVGTFLARSAGCNVSLLPCWQLKVSDGKLYCVLTRDRHCCSRKENPKLSPPPSPPAMQHQLQHHHYYHRSSGRPRQSPAVRTCRLAAWEPYSLKMPYCRSQASNANNVIRPENRIRSMKYGRLAPETG